MKTETVHLADQSSLPSEETREQRIARLRAELASETAGIAEDRATGRLSIGENISHVLTGSILTLTIDLSKNLGKSKSGNSTLVASTKGNQAIGNCKIGLNVYR